MPTIVNHARPLLDCSQYPTKELGEALQWVSVRELWVWIPKSSRVPSKPSVLNLGTAETSHPQVALGNTVR